MYTIVLNLSSEPCLTGKLSYGIYTTMNSSEINTSRTATVNTPDHSTVTTTSNHSEVVTTLNRTALIRALAVIGFIALVGITMWLAVYSTRYVPAIVGRIGSAAVYLSSGVIPSPTPSLSVVPTPTASTTIPFSEASSTISTSASSTTSNLATETPAKSVQKTAGAETSGTYPIGGTAATAPYGLPDFSVSISAIGYLATNSADSFITSSVVPAGTRPAAKFTIKNIGTNWTGTWRFSASIPTRTAYVYQSDPQQSLAPGDSIDYIFGFDSANSGTNQMISITANFDHVAADSNPNNNNIEAYLTIL